jgi:FMN-dependent dehydrogenase
VDWLRSISPLPLLLKGVLAADDATRAVEAGVDGIVVSNRGGRQLDGAPATLDALPEVATAAGANALDVIEPISASRAVSAGSPVAARSRTASIVMSAPTRPMRRAARRMAAERRSSARTFSSSTESTSALWLAGRAAPRSRCGGMVTEVFVI